MRAPVGQPQVGQFDALALGPAPVQRAPFAPAGPARGQHSRRLDANPGDRVPQTSPFIGRHAASCRFVIRLNSQCRQILRSNDGQTIKD